MNYCQFRNDVIKRMCNSVKPLLPPEYQQVEWIQNGAAAWMPNNPSQWFSTDIIPTNHYIHAVIEGFESDTSLFGTSTTYTGYALSYRQGRYTFGITNGESNAVGPDPNQLLTIDYNLNGSIYINNTAIATNRSFSSQYVLWLGGRYSSVSFTRKIYQFQITDRSTNTIIRDYIPCYRISDNQPGLYDICNNEFKTNTSMTFIVGNPV